MGAQAVRQPWETRNEGIHVGPALGRKEAMGGMEAQELWRRQERNL